MLSDTDFPGRFNYVILILTHPFCVTQYYSQGGSRPGCVVFLVFVFKGPSVTFAKLFPW